MASLRNRVLAYYRSLGITVRVKVTEGAVPKNEYERLVERPGITTYVYPNHELWVDHSGLDGDGFPDTVLIRVHRPRNAPPWIELDPRHITEIDDPKIVAVPVERCFEEIYGQNLVRIRIDFDSGNVQPVSREFFNNLRKVETVHSACVIRRDFDYVRINYIDGGHLLYLVPVKLDVAKLL